MLNRIAYTLLLIIFLFNPLTGVAQYQEDTILQERNIFETFGSPPSELNEPGPDHNAPYEYLSREASIEFDETDRGIVAYIHYLNRIKVYSDDPIEQAEAALVGIPYYASENIERVTNLEGITWKENGQFYRLNTENTRNSELNSRYRLIEFEMPEVDAGSILEYKYTLERRYIEELPDFYISDRVPVRKATLFMKNADFLRYGVVEQNVDFELSYQEFEVDTSSIPFVFTYERPDPVNVEVWSAEGIPAIDATSFLSSTDDVRAKLKFQISEFGLPRQPLDNSWELIAAQLRRNSNPYESIDENSTLIDNILERFEEIQSQVEIQDSIFHYVNSNMQFNGTNAVNAEGGLRQVTEGIPANQAEINTLLLGMLREAGIDAYPLFISGREFGRINRSFPSLFQFNQMLVYSEIDGMNYVMDASFAHSLPNLISVNSFNNQGFLLRENDFHWTEINPRKSVFNLWVGIEGDLNQNGRLSGIIRAETTGYPSREVRRSLAGGESESDIIKKIFLDIYPEVELSNTEIVVDELNPDIISIQSGFEIPNYAVSFTEGLEYKPVIVGYLYQNPFESTNRRVPITLDAPEHLFVNYSISLPEGAETENLQGRQITELPGAELSEEYDISDGQLTYSFGVNIERKQFSSDDYSQLRRIYERWVELSNEVWFIETDR
ncbi:MAG: hypothetical protein R6V22_11045 [Rhodohalobacter sp.]|uniref:hypothetical protein n=2 Tax=Rhodohalobacter sp. TaxID=1974210 RepID=UPI0039760503